MAVGGERDRKGTAQVGTGASAGRVLCIGVAGYMVTAGAADLPAVLADDPSHEAHRAFDELCKAGCDPEVLLYTLKVIRHRLPCYWWNGDETADEARRRRDDAAVLDRTAAIIKERYAFFLPRENMTDQDAQSLQGWDYWSIMQGGVSPVRLLARIESMADELRAPDNNTLRIVPLVPVASFPAEPGKTIEVNIDLDKLPPAPAAEEVPLRPNQNPFDVISRAVICAYVRKASKNLVSFSPPVAKDSLMAWSFTDMTGSPAASGSW